jgi:DNA replication protein DnaC
MLTQHTIATLKQLKLNAMAQAFEEQLQQPVTNTLSFEERFAMLLDRERNHRDTKRITRLMSNAKFKFPHACIEDINYRTDRSLDQRQIASLASCDWIRRAQVVIFTGLTGAGKSWLACALGIQACRQGFSAYYVRAPRLFEELKIAHADGSFISRINALAKTDVLVIDDFAVAPMGTQERLDLLEILDDRTTTGATIFTSQLPTDKWHEFMNEPTLADAILDRIFHRAHKLPLKGESQRKDEAIDKENNSRAE